VDAVSNLIAAIGGLITAGVSVGGFFYTMRLTSRRERRTAVQEAAKQLLAEAAADGEITTDELRKIIDTIEEGNS
jgi:uncharacterized membrane protein